MKRLLIALCIGTVTLAAALPAYASDWDKAGKVLTAIEGIRILTGGNVDIIGTITGVNRRGPAVQHVRHSLASLLQTVCSSLDKRM